MSGLENQRTQAQMKQIPNRKQLLGQLAVTDHQADAPGVHPNAPPDRTARRWMLIVLFMAVAGADLVLLSAARYGAGLSPDSVAYLDVARNLASGRGFTFHTGEHLLLWPPLYPIVLALVSLVTRLDPSIFAHVVNAVLFAAVIALSAVLVRESLGQRMPFAALGLATVMLSAPLLDIYAMAWSDCLFIPLVLLYVVATQHYWRQESSAALAIMFVSAGLAVFSRYAGSAIIPAGILTIMLAPRAAIWTRTGRAALFTTLALTPVGLWLALSPKAVGTLLTYEALPGIRIPSGFFSTVGRNFVTCLSTVFRWYIPERSVWVAIALVVIVVALISLALSSKAGRRRLATGAMSILWRHAPILLLASLYAIATVLQISAKHFRYEPRYIAPLFVPVTVVLLGLARLLSGPKWLLPRSVTMKVPTMLLALWLCLPLSSIARAMVNRFQGGAGGYSSRPVRESPTIACTKQILSLNPGTQVYSNGPDALWELAGVNALGLPNREQVGLSQLTGRWPPENENGTIIVWLGALSWRGYLYSVGELQAVADVRALARFSDGALFMVSPLPPPPYWIQE
jgi:hypothetical protein